jgi:hypothetical protein
MKFVADCEGMVGGTSPSRLSKKKGGYMVVHNTIPIYKRILL